MHNILLLCILKYNIHWYWLNTKISALKWEQMWPFCCWKLWVTSVILTNSVRSCISSVPVCILRARSLQTGSRSSLGLAFYMVLQPSVTSQAATAACIRFSLHLAAQVCPQHKFLCKLLMLRLSGAICFHYFTISAYLMTRSDRQGISVAQPHSCYSLSSRIFQ